MLHVQRSVHQEVDFQFVVVKMLVEVDQGNSLLTEPAEGRPAWRVLPLRPAVLFLHVPQHRESVQVAQVQSFWTGCLFGHLVYHPEHEVLHGRVLADVALEV